MLSEVPETNKKAQKMIFRKVSCSGKADRL